MLQSITTTKIHVVQIETEILYILVNHSENDLEVIYAEIKTLRTTETQNSKAWSISESTADTRIEIAIWFSTLN